MKKQAAQPTQPFPVSAQHVRAVVKPQDDAGDDDDSKSVGPSEPVDTKDDTNTDQGVKRKTEWVYSKVRDQYIKDAKNRGCSFFMAKCQWDLSNEKKNLLKDVTLTELKKRRFVAKTATSNPWSQRGTS